MSGRLIVLGFGFLAALAATDVAAQSGYYGGAGNSVRCESNDSRMVYCGGSRDAQLQRQVSKTPCIRGQTWGTDNRGLWVTGGCRGDFLVGGYGYGGDNRWQGGNGQVFRCESNDKRVRQCASNSGGNVRLVRQLSGSPCIEGQSWGRERNGVWVSRGCRAEFQVVQGRRPRWDRWRGGGYNDNGYGNDGYGNQGNQQPVRCESNDGRTKRCGANIDRGVQMTRQLSSSPCTEGQNWGWDRNGIWVSGGCRAEFGVW